jgi:hypothetical protein
MKKYRSLWCMSTTNHNILYFACIRRTSMLNTAICLWKAQNGRNERGFRQSKMPQNLRKSPGRQKSLFPSRA